MTGAMTRRTRQTKRVKRNEWRQKWWNET